MEKLKRENEFLKFIIKTNEKTIKDLKELVETDTEIKRHTKETIDYWRNMALESRPLNQCKTLRLY